ncbi:hypothetical protein [uncultured Winogradskyella sp.]|uniref:hypothetical protein n=1 Tax=uncultured Winogradskyella sp. TaxID=395353 RepID=UPI0026270CD5|nr:hypothetical protein [uncultured Winogradskyella sp.]
MKKIVALFCLFSAFIIFTCDNEPYEDGLEELNTNTNCDAQTITSNAESVYNLDPSIVQTCIAYRTALENQIAECGDVDGSLQLIVDDLGHCGLISAELLKVTVGDFNIVFTTQIITFENGIITTEGVSSGGHYEIFFQVSEGDVGLDSFQNFKIRINDTYYFPAYPGNNNFTSNTLISTNNSFNATFYGTAASVNGIELTLTQGIVDVNY